MNKLLTALILVATAATAQAGEVYLECNISGQPGKSLTMMIDADKGVGDNGFGAVRQASGASTVMTAGSEYVLRDRLGLVIRINRQNLTWTNDDPVIKLNGQCQKATAPKNQI